MPDTLITQYLALNTQRHALPYDDPQRIHLYWQERDIRDQMTVGERCELWAALAEMVPVE